MRVLVTGAGGLLASAIAAEFASCGTVERATHRDLDVTDERAVHVCIDRVRPDVVINCAAFNDVDAAEDRASAALALNAFAVLGLARAAAAHEATLVHYGTDFVFDGETSRPYREEDRPRPRNVYAASKLLGEWFAAEAPRHYVLRVESLFGPPAASGGRRGSLGTIVDRLRQGEEVPVFVDRVVSPSFTIDVASATRRLLASSAPFGTYHCVNDGAATWREVAEEAARQLGVAPRIRPLTLETAALKAARPRYCALSPARLASFGIVMPPWQVALAAFLKG